MDDDTGRSASIQTNWHIVTGAPCSGKTSLIRYLEHEGYQVVHEVARAFINEQLAQKKTLAQIKSDMFTFEKEILNRKLHAEKRLSKNSLVFLDRGIPDSIAYFEFAGLDTSEAIAKSRIHRYKTVFLLNRIQFVKDSVRTENDETAMRLEAFIEKSYRLFNYYIVRVPLMPVRKRVRWILQHL
jgi:predicted ATPase